MSNIIVKQQNNTLNFIKGLACFAIVWMHTNAGGIGNQVIVCLARFGIPLFFMVSGYFTYKKNEVNYTNILAKKIIHIIKLILIATLLYMIWYWIAEPLIKTGSIPNIMNSIQKTLQGINWIDLFVFNVNPICGVLWFLNSLLYCYLIWLLISKIKDKRIIYVAAIIILLIGIVLRVIILRKQLIPEDININYFRNWLFYGLPFFTIGYCIHDYEEKIAKVIKIHHLVIAILVGIIMSFAERLVAPLEVFVGTTIISVALFIIAVEKPDMIKIPIFNKVGERYCFFIYITHIIVRDIVMSIHDIIGIKSGIIIWIIPIIVFILCYIAATCFYTIGDKIKLIGKQ